MNITEPIRRHAVLRPDSVAFVRSDHTAVSYRALDGIIDALAGHLRGLGAEAGMLAGVAIEAQDEFVGLAVTLALARIGVATADLSLPAGMLDLCIVEGAGPRGVPALGLRDVWAAIPGDPAAVPAGAIHRDGGALCRVFSSSGTTGQPKYIPASHALISGRVLGQMLAQGERDDVHICAAGLSGAMGLHDVLRSLFSGGTVVLTHLALAAEAIRRHGVNSMLTSPVILQAVCEALPEGPVPSMVEVEISGGKLPGPLAALAGRRLCAEIVEVYGASEVHVIASAPVRLLAGRAGAVGFVHPGVLVEALDADGAVLPAGQEGVLRVGGAYVGAGYHDDPAGTAAAFRDGWFLTGDVGTVWPDGCLTLAGRASEVINAGGVKISPLVIEEVLLAVPGVRDAAAFGLADALGLDQIWAAVVTEPSPDMAAIAAACQARLGGQAPRFLLQVEFVPRNAAGKVHRDVLMRAARVQQGRG